MSEYERICIEQANRDYRLNVIMFIVTFVSVLLVYLDYRNRKSKESAEKSISIAETFAKQIIEKLSIIHAYFEASKLTELTDKCQFLYFSNFDTEELKNLYSQEVIDNYVHILSTINVDVEIGNKTESLKSIICETLNELEYLCMYITTKVADEKYIYNSLHQQFLKTIAVLYIEISLSNTDSKDKYYTNVISVFNLWKKKYYKAEKKEKRLTSLENSTKRFFSWLKKPKMPKIK